VKIKAYVISRTGLLGAELYAWLLNNGILVEVSSDRHSVITNRNRTAERFLTQDVPNGFTHMLMLDEDSIPIAEGNDILSADGDMLYLGMRSRNGNHSHYGNDDFGCTCFRLSAKLLQELDKQDKPIFDFEYNEKKTAQTKCECQYIRENAEALGYKSQMVGIVGHKVSCIIKPGKEGAGTDIIFA